MTREDLRSKPFRVPIRFLDDEDEEDNADMSKKRHRFRHHPPDSDPPTSPDSDPAATGEEAMTPMTQDALAPDVPLTDAVEPDVLSDFDVPAAEAQPTESAPGADQAETATGAQILDAACVSSATAADAESLRRQLEESLTREKRWLADLDNYRRRTQRTFEEQADARKRAMASDLLELIDDLDRALEHASPEETPLADGVRAIRGKFTAALARHGFTPFNPVGESFDPTTQDAVAAIHHPELENNTVAQVLRIGWKAGEKLLRPANVIVVKND